MTPKYPLPYSVICFYLIRAVNEGKHCDVESIKKAIRARALPEFFAQKNVRVDPLLCTPALHKELIDLIDSVIDYKLLDEAKNGYLLLIAYLLELIQRNVPSSQLRLY